MATSRLQRLIVRLVPRSWAASMEAESRAWVVRCQRCGAERSLWDIGGIRWKSSRRQWTKTRLQCPACGERTWHALEYRGEPEPADPA